MTPKITNAHHALPFHAFFTEEASPGNEYAELWDPLQALLHFNVKTITLPIPAPDVKRLQEVKDFLQVHFLQHDLSLCLLCRKFGLNEFKLKKGFKQLFGFTVFGYVHALKMKTARQLLVAGEMNVNEIADHLGYSSPNHFSAAFRKVYGYPPTRLRRFTFNFFASPKQSRPE